VSGHASPQQLSRLIDGDLPLAERAAVLDHVATCPACAAAHARVVEAAAALRELTPTPWRAGRGAEIAARAAAAPAPGHRRRRPAAAAVAVTVAIAIVVALTALAALPVALVGAHVLAACVGAVAPLGGGSFGRMLLTMLATAVVAPALLYPLARWR
jgi:anti-sigma factor RsiW